MGVMKYKTMVYVVALLAHLLMLLRYYGVMWDKGHYQFFPLLLLAVVWLIHGRLAKLDPSKKVVAGAWPTVWLALDLLFLVLSSLLFRAEFFMPSLMCLMLAYISDRYGKRGFWLAVYPVMLLALIILPLYRLDEKLILWMQGFSSLMASYTLDAFGQIHFLEGVVLRTEKKEFFAEEACSGIRSLFSSLAAIGIYCALYRYPAWRWLFNFVQATFWVLVGNALRIAIVVYVADNWTMAVTTGTTHGMLGLAVFVFIFALSLSTNRVFDVFNEPKALDAPSRPKDQEGAAANAGIVSKSVSPAVVWGSVIVFVAVGLFGIRLLYVKKMKIGQFRASDYTLVSHKVSDLPLVYKGWQQVDFDHELRGRENIFGNESYSWVYQKGNHQLTIAVDGLYHEFHNLAFCYTQTGWKTHFEHHYIDPSKVGKNEAASEAGAQPLATASDGEINSTIISMNNRHGEHGLVWFTAFDNRDELVIPREGMAYYVLYTATIMNNLRLAFGLKDPTRDFTENRYELPIRQIQLFYHHPSPPEEAEREELEELYKEFRDRLLRVKSSQGE